MDKLNGKYDLIISTIDGKFHRDWTRNYNDLVEEIEYQENKHLVDDDLPMVILHLMRGYSYTFDIRRNILYIDIKE